MRHHRAILLGDDLYSRQPLCEAALRNGTDFIFVCHRESHPALYAVGDAVANLGRLASFSYRNEWITNLRLEQENVPEIVACGRAWWKSENENNNVLKNHGYHIDHNFGHGKEYLSTYLTFYNQKRLHQSLGYRPPAEVYLATTPSVDQLATLSNC